MIQTIKRSHNAAEIWKPLEIKLELNTIAKRHNTVKEFFKLDYTPTVTSQEHHDNCVNKLNYLPGRIHQYAETGTFENTIQTRVGNSTTKVDFLLMSLNHESM